MGGGLNGRISAIHQKWPLKADAMELLEFIQGMLNQSRAVKLKI
jgi:hypothetical protein